MSNSGWEKHPHGIEMCRYEKKSLGYGTRIRVNGVTTELPYDTHLAVAALAAEVERLRKAESWLVKVVTGFENGNIKGVSLIQTSEDGKSKSIVSMKNAILSDMGWAFVNDHTVISSQLNLVLAQQKEGVE